MKKASQTSIPSAAATMSPTEETTLSKENVLPVARGRPAHGGDIHSFSQRTGVDLDRCIDLSTGIAPWSWPVPEIPQEVWQVLPTSTNYEQHLLTAAAGYYACDKLDLLPIAGSQAGIEMIPQITKPGATIAYPFPGYEEHRYAWEKSGADMIAYRNYAELERLVKSSSVSHAVVINPNNPSTEAYSLEQLDEIRCILDSRGGFLVVDEAFIDSSPMSSCIKHSMPSGLIVLRSVGKFFGLAGLRLGFVAAGTELLGQLKEYTGLWKISTPTLWLGSKMLSDTQWIETQTTGCKESSDSMLELVRYKFGQLEWRKTDLFVSGTGLATQVLDYQHRLAGVGIHSRCIPLDQQYRLLRLGLANNQGLERIANL